MIFLLRCWFICLLLMNGTLSSASVVYTTDGSEPNASSTIYTTPITVAQTTVLRCRAYQPDSIPSAAVTRSFIFKQDVLAQQEIFRKAEDYGQADSGLEVLGSHFPWANRGKQELLKG